MESKYISLVYWTVVLVWLQRGRKGNIVLKGDLRGGLRCVCVCVEAAALMVGFSEIWVGWSLHWTQRPNSSAHWTPPGGLSRWPLVTMETLAGPGLHWGQLQDCKPGWSDLLKNGQRSNCVCPLCTWRHIQYAAQCWMHHERSQLRNNYRRLGKSGNILALQSLSTISFSPPFLHFTFFCTARWVLASFSA